MAAKAAAFALVVVCARLLPVSEFAHLGIALAALTVVTSLVDGGFSTLIVRDGARCSTEPMALLRASVRVRLPLACVVLLAGLKRLGGLELSAVPPSFLVDGAVHDHAASMNQAPAPEGAGAERPMSA